MPLQRIGKSAPRRRVKLVGKLVAARSARVRRGRRSFSVPAARAPFPLPPSSSAKVIGGRVTAGSTGTFFAPTSRGRIVISSPPVYMATSAANPRGVRVRHREYVAELVSAATASAFGVTFTSGINPGLPGLFPWLSNLAIQYETYRIHGLRFFVSTELPTTQAGSLLACVDYDASDAAPSSKVQLMAYDCSVRCSPWEELVLTTAPSELHKLGPVRYVRSGSVASTDVKTYDAGNVFLATSGISTTALVCGEIYVEYDIEFQTPQMSLPTRALLGSSIYTAKGTISAAAPFGQSAPTVTGGVLMGPDATGVTLGFGNPGEYLVVVESGGTVFTDTLPVIAAVASSGAVITTLSGQLHRNTANTAATVYYSVVVNRAEQFLSGILVTAGTLTLSYAGDSTTYTATVIRVAQYASANG